MTTTTNATAATDRADTTTTSARTRRHLRVVPPADATRPAPACPTPRVLRRSWRTIPAITLAAITAVAGTGYQLGTAGTGLTLLRHLAAIAAGLLVLLGLTLAVLGGTGRRHCPRCPGI